MIGLDLLWLVDRFPNRYRCDWSRSFSVTFMSRCSVMVCITTFPAFSFGDSGIPWEKIELRLVYCSYRSILCSNYSICFSILILLFCRFLTISSFLFFLIAIEFFFSSQLIESFISCSCLPNLILISLDSADSLKKLITLFSALRKRINNIVKKSGFCKVYLKWSPLMVGSSDCFFLDHLHFLTCYWVASFCIKIIYSFFICIYDITKWLFDKCITKIEMFYLINNYNNIKFLRGSFSARKRTCLAFTLSLRYSFNWERETKQNLNNNKKLR